MPDITEIDHNFKYESKYALEDALHPNDLGHYRMAQKLIALLGKIRGMIS